METGKAIYYLLKDSADVGAICADRIYPEIAQQDADVPFIAYTITDTTPSGTKSGSSDLDTARVELYIVSDDYAEAMDLGIAVRSALDRQGGDIGPVGNTVAVQSIDFDTSDVDYDQEQGVYITEHTYNMRIQRTGQAGSFTVTPNNAINVSEVDGDPSGAITNLKFSNGTVTIDGNTATVVSGGGPVGDSYHGRYDTQAETERSGATGNVEYYYTARPDGDGEAESETSDTGETDTINRTLAYSTKFRADPDTAADWTDYTTQPADNASFATAKAALLAGLNETDATAETRGTLPLSLKMTRTTTAADPNLLLDTYTGAAAAYSVRKLDKDYTGSCMRIRRSSDEATQDIGFDSNGDLDTAAIASFVGDAYGYVTAWYDQSGNGRNMTQSTSANQPMIYDRVAAAVVTENGKAAIEWDGTNDALQHTFSTASTLFRTNMTAFIVNTVESTPDRRPIITVDPTTTDLYTPYVEYRGTQIRLFSGQSGDFQLTTGTPATQGTQNLISLLKDGTTSQTIYVDGSSAGTSVSKNATLTMDAMLLGSWYAGGRHYHGTMQEIIMWNSAESTDRADIETEIMDYFSIT
jgi:hypothetical protein